MVEPKFLRRRLISDSKFQIPDSKPMFLLSTVNHQPSTIFRTTNNEQRNTINHQPSTINYFSEQQTTNNEQPSTINALSASK